MKLNFVASALPWRAKLETVCDLYCRELVIVCACGRTTGSTARSFYYHKAFASFGGTNAFKIYDANRDGGNAHPYAMRTPLTITYQRIVGPTLRVAFAAHYRELAPYILTLASVRKENFGIRGTCSS